MLFLTRRRHSQTRMPMMIRAAAPPTAIPAIAPVESPVDESSFAAAADVVDEDVDEGVPDGSADDVELGGRKAMALTLSSERTA